jgi:hypothetical protein
MLYLSILDNPVTPRWRFQATRTPPLAPLDGRKENWQKSEPKAARIVIVEMTAILVSWRQTTSALEDRTRFRTEFRPLLGLHAIACARTRECGAE